ncbi:CARDB domain-containing protein [Methanothermococcus okinawensis]|uniref:APHP domain protein n=1 Tax=Methanothermococcus okinawensis (strain DSM 14208 / JCM 11175 / IH1) TaxID=647113 RepID=F8AJM3_METOI|nr:CARDB domain-containing protein [Methanothermococcus okinawensis]AEH07210.1 APHP domain protein [Methanothermococcus okinawensis IH1]
MKWKFFTLSVLMISLIGMCYAENVSVELIPNNISANVGDTINLDLIVKNVPDNLKCEGFETYIYYNSSMLNISKNDVVLKDVSGSISKENITVSNGEIWISLWFSKDFSGNFTIAALSFKALNEGTGNVSLHNTVVSDANGQHIEDNPNISLVLKNSNMDIIIKPIADIITPKIANSELGENITIPIIISPKENETINEICGTLSYDKTIVNPVNLSSSDGIVSFNISNGFFKIENINKSSNFTINVTYNVINVGSTATQLRDVAIKDIENYSVVKNSDIINIYIPGPDLVITNISIPCLKSYQDNIIPITVKNIGERNISNNFTVTLYMDANEIGKKTVNGLTIGKTKTTNFTFMPLDNKNYTLVAVVDSSGKIKETNETNNKYVKIVEAVEQPISLNLVPSTNLTKTGETFTVDIKLNNITDKRPAKGIDGVLTYDSKVLNCTNFTFSINASENLKNITFKNGKVLFSIMDGNITKPTVIGRATFKAINVGNSNIGLENVVVSDINGYKFNKIFIYPKTMTVEGPDAYIKNISVENPYYLEPAIVKVEVSNKGHADSTETFDVHLYVDSNDLGTKTVNNLSIGKTKTISFNWIPQDKKNYTIVALINPTVDENVSNNKLVKKVMIVEQPISLNLVPSTNLTKTGETFTVDIKLNNITDKRPAKGIDGVLTYDSKILECTNVTFSINASENLKNITFENGKVLFSIMDGNITKPTVIGKATFKALDVGNSEIGLCGVAVSDINGYKFNNVITTPKTVVVQGPNIKITSIDVSNPSLYRAPTTINITITNNGHQDIINKSFDVHLYVDSNDLGTKTVNNLLIGETKTLSFNWTPTDIKTYTVVAIADKFNAVKEENESDNKLVKKVNVVEEPVWLKLYNRSESNGTITASIDVDSINPKRPCSGYDLGLTLKNVEILNISGIGTCYWNLTNGSLFVSGYNFSKSGKFNIGNITFKVINKNDTSYLIIKHAVLSDWKGYKFKRIFLNNTITTKTINEALKSINMDSKVWNLTELDKIDIISESFNITVVPIENDTLRIPILENISINLTEENVETLEEVKQKATEFNNIKIENENDIYKIINNTEIKPIVNTGFNITNITKETKKENNKVISSIKFNVTNTSTKGLSITRIPIGPLNVEGITVNNGTKNITLKENDYSSKIGWYTIPTKGVLEITLVKDPEVNVILSATLPSITTTYYSGGGGSHHMTIKTYSDVAQDIKSEKIKEIVHNYKLILGSEIDNNMSAKHLKNTSELINKPLEIKEDCILIGGPVANPLVKKFLWTFPVKVTNDYPGAHMGVIQKQIINGHNVILLAGSDRYGTKAAVEYFKTLDDIPSEPIFVEWKDNKAIKINKP